MDIPRPDQARKRRRQRILYGSGGLVLLALVTLGLSRLKPAAPSIDRNTVVIDTVKRGELLRDVSGNGTLVPEEIRWVAARSSGRIEQIFVLAGAQVKADTIMLELSNPELQQETFDAEWQLKAIEAERVNLKVQLETQRLNQQAATATAEANHSQAKLEAEVNEELSKASLIPSITLRQSKTRAEQLEKLLVIERERLAISADSAQAQLAVQEARVSQLRALLELKRTQVDGLKIRAGTDGVVQQLGAADSPLRVGQQVAPGVNLARVANPAKLKAEIKIPETQAKDILHGQSALIDTRNGVVPGRVIRIDPAVQNGTRTVDVALEGPLPKGAVPDLSVDGRIELERLQNVLYVGRFVHGQADGTIGVYRLVEGGGEAVRVPVKLGRSSVKDIEILSGLQAGERVIVSDMSQWDAYERIKLD